jgi:hypothetical protein
VEVAVLGERESQEREKQVGKRRERKVGRGKEEGDGCSG